MTNSSDLVFDETYTYINTPCPEWCTLSPLHPVDNGVPGGVDFRIHGCPAWGGYLYGYANEYVDEPGVLYAGITLDTSGQAPGDDQHFAMSHLDLEQLARHTEEARAWLSKVLRQDNVKPAQVRR